MSISENKYHMTLHMIKKIIGTSEKYSGTFFNWKNSKDDPNFSVGMISAQS